MKAPRPSRFINNSKSKDFFPIKQYRFDATNHPIIQSRKECKFRLKTILSHQEEQQLEGMINELQCSKREAIRIAFYEAVRRGSKWVETVLIYALRDSKERGHTARSKKLTVALPNSEKQALLELGKELDLSENEIVRLAIIWLANGIKEEKITRIHKCLRISYDRVADKWSKENRGKPPNPQVKKLKEQRDLHNEIFETLRLGAALPITNCVFYDHWKLFSHQLEELMDYGFKYGIDLSNLYRWDKDILAFMLLYRISYKQAIDIYNEDKIEAKRIMNLSRSDFLQMLKDNIDRDYDSELVTKTKSEDSFDEEIEDETIIKEFAENRKEYSQSAKDEEEQEKLDKIATSFISDLYNERPLEGLRTLD